MNDRTKPTSVSFTIDGQPFTTEDQNQKAEELLALAGLDAATYDLAEIGKDGQVKKFQDSQNVHIKDGDEYVSVRQEAPVA